MFIFLITKSTISIRDILHELDDSCKIWRSLYNFVMEHQREKKQEEKAL